MTLFDARGGRRSPAPASSFSDYQTNDSPTNDSRTNDSLTNDSPTILQLPGFFETLFHRVERQQRTLHAPHTQAHTAHDFLNIG